MTLDVRKLAAAKRSEEDGGVDMGAPSGNARLHVGETETSLRHGDQKVRLDGAGVHLGGKALQVEVPFDRILFNGIFRFNPDLMLGIPSTIVTPQPVLVPSPGQAFRPLVEMIGILRDQLTGGS